MVSLIPSTPTAARIALSSRPLLLSAPLPFSIFGVGFPLRKDLSIPSTSQDNKEDAEEEDRKDSIQPPPTTKIRRLCQVCDTPGATPHYGGIVCGGCKIFFARAVQRKLYYVCDKNGICRMLPGRRNFFFNLTPLGKRSKCRYCRFQRCLKAKMSIEGRKFFSGSLIICCEEVGRLRDMKVPAGLLCPKEEDSVVPYFDIAALKESLIDQQLLLERAFAQKYPSYSSVDSIVRRFLNTEHSCDNASCPFSPPDNIFCSLDVPLIDALRNPLMICERTPIFWEKACAGRVSCARVKQAYCRLLLHYLEFIGVVDDLYQIKEPQRLAFVADRAVSMVLLTSVYNSFKYKQEGLLLDGFMISSDNCLPSRVRNYILDSVGQLIDRMKAVDLSEEEYIMLKLVNFFSLGGSNEDSQALVRSLRFKYLRFLTSHLEEKFPKEKALARLANLLELLKLISKSVELLSLFVATMVVFDVGGLRHRLSYDIHLRRYE